jgi:hypothetical protein
MRKRSTTFANVVGRIDAEDVEADEAEQLQAAERARRDREEQERLDAERKVRLQKAIQLAMTYCADNEIRHLTAEYRDADDDKVTCDRLEAIINPIAVDGELLDEAFAAEVRSFGKLTLQAVEPYLVTAEALESASCDAGSMRAKFTRARMSLASGLELARLRRRRARIHSVLSLLDRVRAWDEKTDAVKQLVLQQRFGEAISSLNIGTVNTVGSPQLATANFFDSTDVLNLTPRAIAASPFSDGPGTSASPLRDAEVPEVILAAAGEDVISTVIGACAIRRWLTLSDTNNPFVIDHVRRVTCRLIATPRVLNAFSCFHRNDAAPTAAAVEPIGNEENAEGSQSDQFASEPEESTSSQLNNTDSAFLPSITAAKPTGSDLDWSSESDDDNYAYGRPQASDGSQPTSKKTKKHKHTHKKTDDATESGNKIRSLADTFADQLTPEEQHVESDTLDRVIDGLRALHFSPANFVRFFGTSFQLALDFVLLQTCVDTLGEDTKETWEEIVDTLVPSELHRTTSNVVGGMMALIRSARRHRAHAADVVKRAAAGTSPKPPEVHSQPTPAVSEDGPQHLDPDASLPHDAGEATGPRDGKSLWRRAVRTATSEVKNEAVPHANLLSFHTVAVQKCMASIMAYASRVPLARATVHEVLHFFQMLLDFVRDCEPLSDDRSPESTHDALVKVLASRLETYFATTLTQDLSRLMFAESFNPFQANHDDFAVLDLLMPPESGTGPADASGGSVGSVLDTVSIFTFTSLKTCERMLELADAVKGCPAAAGAVMRLVVSVAAQYVWFVVVNVATVNESTAFPDNSGVPESARMAAAAVSEAAFALGAAEGYPRFNQHAPCHMWKSSIGEATLMHAARERSTALASLEAVAHTQQLCLKSVSLLLDGSALDVLTTQAQDAVTTANAAAHYGLRRLASNLYNAETVATAMERVRWDDKVVTGGDTSALFRSIRETFFALHDKLKIVSAEQGASRAIQRILQYVIYNICAGFIDGAVKVRKWSDAGRTALVADATALVRLLKSSVPNMTPALGEWVLRFAKAVAAPSGSGAIEELYSQHHSLYTERQLSAVAEREGYGRKRELAALLQKLNHVDKAPFNSLIDSRV